MHDVYRPRRAARSVFVEARGLRHHLRCWGDDRGRPLVMVHGWMDVSASFQFVVDALARDRRVIAPDWRGFGLTSRPATDCYWFPDYLADLDALLRVVAPEGTVDLVGHSMGGNVAMTFAGVRPERVRRLVNLEGFGMAATRPAQAPARLRQWLDELADAPRLRDYPTVEAVAGRLVQTNPRLPADKARWLAAHWCVERAPGRHELLGDPAHKVVNPYLYRADETAAVWACIEAPVLLVRAAEGHARRYGETDEFRERWRVVPHGRDVRIDDAGHMLHHDQPERVAAAIEEFVDV
jgi:pimeloyl-ACP methyl ester carboxylesterase